MGANYSALFKLVWLIKVDVEWTMVFYATLNQAENATRGTLLKWVWGKLSRYLYRQTSTPFSHCCLLRQEILIYSMSGLLVVLKFLTIMCFLTIKSMRPRFNNNLMFYDIIHLAITSKLIKPIDESQCSIFLDDGHYRLVKDRHYRVFTNQNSLFSEII